MLPGADKRTKQRRTAPLWGLVWLVGCSTVPDARFPDFAEHHVAAEFVVPAAGRLRLPASNRTLIVQELSLDPIPQREQFGADGERWLVYPAGTTVHVRCRFRAYAARDGQVPSPAEVLAGAQSIRTLETP